MTSDIPRDLPVRAGMPPRSRAGPITRQDRVAGHGMHSVVRLEAGFFLQERRAQVHAASRRQTEGQGQRVVTSAGETGAPLTKRASERGFNFKFAVDPGGCVLPS